MLVASPATDNTISDLNNSVNSMQTSTPQQLLGSNSNNYLESAANVDSFFTDALDVFSKAGTQPRIAHNHAAPSDPLTADPSPSGISSFKEEEDQEEEGEEDEPNAVTWKLKLSPSMMILDTNILTVAGLEKVLEQLKINVQPQAEANDSNSMLYDLSPILTPSQRMVILGAIKSVYPSYTLEPINLAHYQNVMCTQLTNECVEEFFSCFNEPVWNINRSAFMSTYNPTAILDWKSTQFSEGIDVLLQASVCSVTIGHLLLVHRQLPYLNVTGLMGIYHLKAKEILEDYFDVGDIRVVMSLLMLSNPPNTPAGDYLTLSRDKNIYLELAIRMSDAIGLFEIDRRKTLISNEHELERGRRLAWVILCMEFFSASNTTGGTGYIDLRHWQVNLPTALPSEPQTTHKSIEYLSHFGQMVMQYKTGYPGILRITHQTAMNAQNLQRFLQPLFTQMKENATKFLKLDVDREMYGDLEQLSAEPIPQRPFSILALNLHLLFHSLALNVYTSFIPVKSIAYDKSLQGFRERPVHTSTNINANLTTSQPQNIHYLGASPHGSPATSQMSPKPSQDVSATPSQLYCTVSAVVTTTMMIGLLEAILQRDTTMCHHDPLYGLVQLTHTCQYISSVSKDDGVLSLCSINITRARILLERLPLCRTGDSRCMELLTRLRIWQGLDPSSKSVPTSLVETQSLRSSGQELANQLQQRVGSFNESTPSWSTPRPSYPSRHTTETSDDDQQVKLEPADDRMGPQDEEYYSGSSYED
ncbi:hypothetical protein K450DRAFT_242965 [Umbelopsis ramanniana AG]|uniref:Transcription factor domain-containing protein n=1 Tax=Umbelopsis ramanniana AG TaxID=1314678 RepID=A0AAD5E961_UMBRA|nr:uncharacterized protein K450DRAFT_242965 [Umbelopsis ramanniana AG]KAI8579142.1 hypothetical protein K450DRAFT_242965 [Umbelopsis ramanniana AG]